MRVSLYNHGGGNFVPKLYNAVRAMGLDWTEENSVTDLRDADIGVAHTEIGEENENQWTDMVNQAKQGSIQIRLSTGEMYGSPEPAMSNNNKVCMLYLRKSANPLKMSDWVTILEGLIAIKDDPQRIISGRDCRYIRAFFVDRPTKLLPALSILCEGYLCVHAAADDQQDSEEINRALEAIGWKRLTPEEIAETSEQLKSKKDTVDSCAYWDIFGIVSDDDETERDEKTRGLKEQIRIEMGCRGSEELPEPVANLLEALRLRQSISPVIVAGAYLAFNTKLGGSLV